MIDSVVIPASMGISESEEKAGKLKMNGDNQFQSYDTAIPAAATTASTFYEAEEDEYDDEEEEEEEADDDVDPSSSRSVAVGSGAGRGGSSGNNGGMVGDPVEIQENDVLCGRQKVTHAHPGNKKFRKMVQKRQREYKASRVRDDKTKITLECITKVKEYGGRFLKQNESTLLWYEVDAAYTHEKVSHALRSAKDPDRPRVKTSRKVMVAEPTPEEEEAFAELALEQERIFYMLKAKNNNTSNNNSNSNSSPITASAFVPALHHPQQQQQQQHHHHHQQQEEQGPNRYYSFQK